jgi:hypothetical protein
MRKNSPWVFVALAALAAAGCTSEMTAQKVRIEIPAIPTLKTGDIAEIVLAPFQIENEVKDFDLNQDLVDYFQDQLKTKFKGPISAKTIAWTGAETATDAAFWKKAALGPAGTIVLTGKAAFAQESRKALLSTEKRKFEGPFEPEKKWAERRNFDLKLDVLVLKADTGEVVFRNTFQDTINYENMRQTPAFAFHDLLLRIKPRLFRALFGAEKTQERFLLLK